MKDDAAYAALIESAGPVSRETFVRLKEFESIFHRWTRRINLAAPSTLPHLWERHIVDSARLFRIAPEATLWLDLGSGGGFPGAIVAILLAERPGGHIDLIESNRKKAAFLQTALAGLEASARVHSRRIEECYDTIPTPEIVTARALAPLVRLLELAEPWLARGATALFHKGRDYQREIEESGDAWRFDLVKHDESVGGDGVILEISNLQRAHQQLVRR